MYPKIKAIALYIIITEFLYTLKRDAYRLVIGGLTPLTVQKKKKAANATFLWAD